MFSRITSFFQEAKQEFNRVNWPNFKETATMTVIVIGTSLLVAVFLGLLDFIFVALLRILI